MLKIYENIKEFRKANRWSQEELALKMGYTDRSSIAKIEAGEVDLPQSKILKFAKVFGVNAGDLMGDDGTDTVIEPYIRTTEAIELFDLYQSAAPNVQTAVDALLGFQRPDASLPHPQDNKDEQKSQDT